ncbi:MAG TPA: class I SAM-dependent methyltransferase [Bacteroidales bacterium]|nr:class I SAM-dependent methyltransferase [Bacteroidales bacterium]
MNQHAIAPEKCQVCENKILREFLQLRDYFLSQEEFTLLKCLNCGLLHTIPRPAKEEVGSYYNSKDYTSHNNTKLSLKNILYRKARYYALSRKLKFIKKYSSHGKILDIGSGTGEFLNFCKKNGWETLGIEPNKAARDFSIRNYGLKILESEQYLRTEKTSFEVISMWHVLEHLENPVEQFAMNRELLKENGLLVVALPNYESWDARYYGKFWAAYDVPRHLFHFPEKAVLWLAQKTGFTFLEKQPLKLDAFYISLLSEKYAHGKMNYFRAFFNGLRSNQKAKTGKFGYSSWVYLMTRK